MNSAINRAVNVLCILNYSCDPAVVLFAAGKLAAYPYKTRGVGGGGGGGK